MSFRFKIIIGVAFIQGVLLVLFVLNSMSYLALESEKDLAIRGKTTSELLTNLTRDAILTTDLARLESVADQVLKSTEIVYLRIMREGGDLLTVGDTSILTRPFVEDLKLQEVDDEIFDVSSEIVMDGVVYGRLELGLSVRRYNESLAAAQKNLTGFAVIEMVLVALFLFVLGAYFPRRINHVTAALSELSEGIPEKSLEVTGNDEQALAGTAFNKMSRRLADSHRDIRRGNIESSSLAAELSSQQQRLSSILNIAVDGFVITDKSGKIDEINEAGARLFGYGHEELQGTNVSLLMPKPFEREVSVDIPIDHEATFSPILGAHLEIEGLRRDGSTFPIDLAVSELRVGGQRMFVGLIRNLTEHKLIKYELSKSETLKVAVMDANLDALVTIDANSCIIEFSSQAEELFGYERAEVLGQSMAELLIPVEMRSKHTFGMERYLKSRIGSIVGERIEVEAMRKSGELFPIELTVQSVTIDDQIIFTAFIRDITERHKFEAELVQAKQNAEEASEAKSRFLATMSHEIRSPLNVVLGSMGLLLDDELDNEKRLYAKTAKTSAKTLLSLINDILDFSKIEAGQIQLENKIFNLADLVNDVADSMIIHTRPQHVQTAIVLDPGLDSDLIGDPTRLRQILINLTDNALKFTKEGSIVLAIRKASETESCVDLRFSVQDTGIGIAANEQDRMFGEFQQVDSSDSTLYSGTGLGLSICHGLCSAMGGTIALKSELGKGSSFEVQISLAKASSASTTDFTANTSQQFKLLIVGLSSLVSEAMIKNVDATGPTIRMVQTIDEAIPHISPDIEAIFIDASLSEVDLAGLSARARIIGVKHVILMSSNVTTEVGAWVRDGIYDDVLVMPLVMTRMIDLLGGVSASKPFALEKSASDRSNVRVVDELKPAETEEVVVGSILLAEDSPANQIVAQGLLTKFGYKVDIVHNGREAIEAHHNGSYDLILMDLRMPIMNGLEATAIIRAEESDSRIPIIALTANASKEDKDRCFSAGMDDFVTKPMDKEQLFEVLNRQFDVQPVSSSNNTLTSIEENVGMDTSSSYKSSLILDMGVIDKLVEDTSAEAVPDMLKVFVTEIATRANRVANGLNTLSLDSLEDEAHTIKSCSATFGAVKLHLLALDFESACRNGDRKVAVELAAQIPGFVEITLETYRKHFSFLN
ncbi:MAG: two-component system sensor histidine kinase/response regulator [Oceanicoccus sp.]|jgi:two-component system sensor histidine kinase/response regulator